MRLISAAEIRKALPMTRAAELMAEALAAITRNEVISPERLVLPMEQGTGLLMGAAAAGQGIAAKLVSVLPGNRKRGLPGSRGMLFLQDDHNGDPLALIDGTALTAWRTAAAAACATDLLARPGAHRGLLVGCGTQAETQLLAMDSVRNLEQIEVMSCSLSEAVAFADVMQEHCSARLTAVAPNAANIESADLITSATTSLEPVLDGRRVSPGCHVNGIGSFRPDMREFDQALLQKARVFVEHRVSALAEAGELIAADEAGVSRSDQWTELGRVVDKKAGGRQTPEDITFFKSVGQAAYDLWAARAVFEAAQKLNLGTLWES
jgi:ornithine cyclodeaminase